MRVEPFLRWMAGHYDPQRAEDIAATVRFKGGWEGWLQVEIARVFLNTSNTQVCGREVAYPSGTGKYLTPSGDVTSDLNSAARADFFMRRKGLSSTDDTFIELKCTNQYNKTPVPDAWKRFQKDLAKIAKLQAANTNLNCIALLAYWGKLEFEKSNETLTVGGIPSSQLWSETMRTYIWRTSVEFDSEDIENGAVLSLRTLYDMLQGEDQDNGLIILGASPILSYG